MKTYKLGLSGKEVAEKFELLDDLGSACAYGICETAGNVAAKEVTIIKPAEGWTLQTGSRVLVYFNESNYSASANTPTLNVNGTGAKYIRHNGVDVSLNSPYAGQMFSYIEYVYDGEYWQVVGTSWDPDTDTTYTNATLGHAYGTNPDGATVTLRTVLINGYEQTTGGIVSIKFTNAVPANAVLNINLKTAKPIYYRGSAITDGVIKAGDTATFMYDGTNYNLISIDRVENENTSSNSSIAYGTCSTAATTAAKEVTIVSPAEGWTLQTGSRVIVKFTNSNSASSAPTLNVNNTGAKSIYMNNSALGGYSNYAGVANRLIEYMYDGTNWVFIGWSYDTDTNTTYSNATLGQGYGTCSTAASTAAKETVISGYTLITGGVVTVKFTNAVPANATLKIKTSSTATSGTAKSIYYNGSAITANVIKAGATATFIFDGTNYNLIAIDPATSFSTFYITSGHSNMTTPGTRATAEGSDTTASGNYSHAEGTDSQATAMAAHAEGDQTFANGEGSHSEGHFSHAYGRYSHAEGSECVAGSDDAINTTDVGVGAHAEGIGTTAAGTGSHSEGWCTVVSGEYAHAEGYSTTAKSDACHAEGNTTSVTGSNGGHAEGYYSTVTSGSGAHAEGYQGRASGSGAHAEGYYTNTTSYGATAQGAHSEGYNTLASGSYSHAEGSSTSASGTAAHAEGLGTTASGYCSHAAGYYTKANSFNYVIGHYNKFTSGSVPATKTGVGSTTYSSGDAFVIGNGYSSILSNAFRVAYNGNVYTYDANGKYNAGSADYAEYFEWLDGNTEAEDRRGYFVTLDGDKITLAKSGDYVLGIVSGHPGVVGNSPEEWQGRYLRDEFGSTVQEQVEYEVEEEVFDEETQEIKLVPTGIKKMGVTYKENPEYDPDREYVSREERHEWAPIGLLGVLSVRDDGTCQVNGYCTVADGGIATASETGYRVIKRVNDHVVKVVFR